MIKTGENKSGNLYVTDDVCAKNLDVVKKLFEEADLVITEKFSPPIPGATVLGGSTVDLILQRFDTFNIGTETQVRNVKAKAAYWCMHEFADAVNAITNDKPYSVFVNNRITNHEALFLHCLNEMGVNVTVVDCAPTRLPKGWPVTVYGTNEHLSYDGSAQKLVTTNTSIASLKEMEDVIYTQKGVVKLCVWGVENYRDTCDVYAKLYNEAESNNTFQYYVHKFPQPTPADTSRFNRFTRNNYDYVMHTMLEYVNTPDKEKRIQICDAIQVVFAQNMDCTKLYNKLVYTIVNICNLVAAGVDHVIFFGTPNVNDELILRVLNRLSWMSVIVLMYDKSRKIPDFRVLELPDTLKEMELPIVDTRSNARTLGSIASRVADETLFADSTLGLYRPGTFCTCNVKLFETAYEEVELWWNRVMYERPGFSGEGSTATLPCMFKLIRGVPEGTLSEYVSKLVGKFTEGSTCFYRSVEALDGVVDGYSSDAIRMLHGTDINGTRMADQLPFYKNGHLVFDRIRNGKNFRYRFLSADRQQFILEKIDELLNSGFLNMKMTEQEIDYVLSTLLNLGQNLLRYIQSFEFYNENPNIVVLQPDDKVMEFRHAALLVFFYLCGFDVLIFVPTKYASIESFVTNKFQYQVHDIGFAEYAVNPNAPVEVDSATKKKSFFGKLFG